MRHTIETLHGLLAELQVRFECLPEVSIDWISEDQLTDYFGCAVCAACYIPTRTVVVSDEYQRAPLYVLRYLVLHEALHLLHKPVGTNMHPRAFRVAEQASSDYVKALRWLHRHSNQHGKQRSPDSRKSAFWRKVISPLYGGDTAAAYARYLQCCSGRFESQLNAATKTGRAKSKA